MATTTASRSDLETLQALNRDYINSVQAGDVRRFDQILADDFLCSNPDGTLIDREAFLKQTAQPVKISNLQAHDVNILLAGRLRPRNARLALGPLKRALPAPRPTGIPRHRPCRLPSWPAQRTGELLNKAGRRRLALPVHDP